MEDYREYEDIRIANFVVKCGTCKSTKFKVGKAQLNTRGLTFFGLDWLNHSSIIMICSKCGTIRWFLRSKYDLMMKEFFEFEEEKYKGDIKESIQCLNCGSTIPADEIKCPKCGWTYK